VVRRFPPNSGGRGTKKDSADLIPGVRQCRHRRHLELWFPRRSILSLKPIPYLEAGADAGAEASADAGADADADADAGADAADAAETD
jgi:hypothetical protein